jgi:hypothetical protein
VRQTLIRQSHVPHGEEEQLLYEGCNGTGYQTMQQNKSFASERIRRTNNDGLTLEWSCHGQAMDSEWVWWRINQLGFKEGTVFPLNAGNDKVGRIWRGPAVFPGNDVRFYLL